MVGIHAWQYNEDETMGRLIGSFVGAGLGLGLCQYLNGSIPWWMWLGVGVSVYIQVRELRT
ncbi:hypothetical protein Geu3261_0093_023 [Komagataeibacter europaeus NBRC 3261]|uniref:Uncharacterized protein n=1 Tax=Komagataeibacter europaeus NBRC 3261 TaxID=1234669 RepID=A0A0D6Q199_KOMEU|nr:hypothetical protein Geu3261_0093_023 [Komagataeibacter europaeus NBRC 3261]